MKKFLLNVITFCFLVFILSYAFDYVVTEGLRKCNYAEFNDWNKILNGSINSDFVISGSSKAQVQFLPQIFDSVLKTNSYNLAVNGHDFNMQKTKFDVYTQKNNYPKVLVQVASNKTMEKREDLFEMNQFLPYLDNNYICSATKEYEGLESHHYVVPLTRYIGKYYLQYVGFVSYFNLPINYLKDVKFKGSIAHDKSWDGSFEKFVKTNPEGVKYRIDKSSDIKFKSFLQDLDKNNVMVFLVYPPVYFESKQYVINRDEIINYYKKKASEYSNVFYLDYSSVELTNNKTNFYNSQHLNKKGAKEFSTILAIDIKKSLDEIRTHSTYN